MGTSAAALGVIAAGWAGSDSDSEQARLIDVDTVRVAIESCGARYLTAADAEYPPGLEELHDPPLGLFVRGRALGELLQGVAIVGARSCSPLGREIAQDLGRGLAELGVCVVSGAARGIDAAAHRGALDAKGPTIAVLGSGIDVPYPASSRHLIEEVATTGSIVSEYAPGVQAEPFRFPARNRIVAGLSRAVVVVEGEKDSGSKITADHGLDLGRDVFAIPGSVTSPLAEAPLELIREGAVMIRGVGDLMEDLGYGAAKRAELMTVRLPSDEVAVWRALDGPTLPERVAATAGMSVPDAVVALMRLEIHGLVRNVGGRYERRLAGG